MKLLVIGATGKTGGKIVEHALSAGHTVTVLVRSPSKLGDLQSQLQVVQGDAIDPVAVDQAVAGQDAILSGLGMVSNSPEELCSNFTKAVLPAMRKHGVRRLIIESGVGYPVPGDPTTFSVKFVNWFAMTFMKKKDTDKQHQYELLQTVSDIDWFLVRPGRIVDGKRTRTYKLGSVFGAMATISHDDVADAMLDMLTDDTWLRKAPAILY
eukprot:TRINITY_DN15422_c0_g1_i1.p1 TRINITY_DN15422_c0_g1~~TRINITY_DN15422_c0_g1_i1.p1  ORF type:complete len:210 (+),score=25.36 TRINITY_DN15422_c0_g1_i1:52-681(+)